MSAPCGPGPHIFRFGVWKCLRCGLIDYAPDRLCPKCGVHHIVGEPLRPEPRRRTYPPLSRRQTLRAVAVLAFVCVVVAWSMKACGEDVSLAKPLAIYTGAAGLDFASTRYLIDHGGREAWLPSQGSGSQAAMKLGAAALLTFGDVELQKHGHAGWARAVRIVVPAAWGYAAFLNVRRAR